MGLAPLNAPSAKIKLAIKTFQIVFLNTTYERTLSCKALEQVELRGQSWLVPHQANKRIIDATADRMGLPKEKVMINIQKFGNTTAATIPLCLWEWESQLKKGDNLILAAFGGGFTWGAAWVKWAY